MDVVTLALARKYVDDKPMTGNIDGGKPGTIFVEFTIDGGGVDTWQS